MADALTSLWRSLFLSGGLFGSASLLADTQGALTSSQVEWTGRLFFIIFLLFMASLLFALVALVLTPQKPQST